ncbi:MAG: Flp family type IVb pilin [Methylocystis sp.]|nr:MAG: Flp family type IVb pilin [Methylocystis sp.]
MLISLRKFLNDEAGATAIEYSLLVGVLVLAIIAGSRAIGTTLSATFPKITGNLG